MAQTIILPVFIVDRFVNPVQRISSSSETLFTYATIIIFTLVEFFFFLPFFLMEDIGPALSRFFVQVFPLLVIVTIIGNYLPENWPHAALVIIGILLTGLTLIVLYTRKLVAALSLRTLYKLLGFLMGVFCWFTFYILGSIG